MSEIVLWHDRAAMRASGRCGGGGGVFRSALYGRDDAMIQNIAMTDVQGNDWHDRAIAPWVSQWLDAIARDQIECLPTWGDQVLALYPHMIRSADRRRAAATGNLQVVDRQEMAHVLLTWQDHMVAMINRNELPALLDSTGLVAARGFLIALTADDVDSLTCAVAVGPARVSAALWRRLIAGGDAIPSDRDVALVAKTIRAWIGKSEA